MNVVVSLGVMKRLCCPSIERVQKERCYCSRYQNKYDIFKFILSIDMNINIDINNDDVN